MRVWGQVYGPRFWAALGLGLACLAAPQAASAHSYHHHHRFWYAGYHHRHPVEAVPVPYVPPSAGFGPTSPGPSMILIDAGSGRVISEAGADVPRYPASLTKLMTLDLAFQALRDGRMSLDTQIPVSYHAAAVEPVKLGLPPGSTISVHDAILAMTTMSANDAATALGEYLGGGSEARCAEMMTLRAHALGMAQTEFYNASGLPDPNQITTARDLSILARDIVVSYPDDQKFFEVQQFDFEGRTVYSNNQMLKIYPGATGMKTGYTILARHNLVTSAVRNGEVLIGVELHEPSWGATYQQMTAMLNAGFSGYAYNGYNGGGNMAVASSTAPAPVLPQAPVATAPLPDPSLAPPVYSASWIAQLGLYSRMSRARIAAIRVRQMQGMGIARIAPVHRNGQILWTAQLAGLTLSAAHETCSALTAHGASCRVIERPADHWAMDGSAPDSGT